MNYSTAQPKSRYAAVDDMQPGATLLIATSISGYEVCNFQDERLGKIQDVILDMTEGRIRYAVLASDGFLDMSDRLFAVPWMALKQDIQNKRFMLDVDI